MISYAGALRNKFWRVHMKILLVLLLAFSYPIAPEEPKTIFLISTPRSLSSGFMRMMQERNDFEIFHEPTNAPFHIMHDQSYYDETYRTDSFQSYNEILESILTENKKSNVFIKDLSFTCHEFLTKENPLLQSAHFAFLVRKPQDVILSLYQKGLPPSIAQEVAGYQKFYELFELVEKHGKYPPYLFFSEDLGKNPEKTVASFCEHMGIAFKPESLTWKALGDQFEGEEWHDRKKIEAIQHWHADVIQSTCFVSLRTAEIDSDGVPTFSEITNPEDRAKCLEIYQRLLPYYVALKEKWEVMPSESAI